jgi:peptidoglycan-N-acetylglucosamine deacetylase
VNSNVHSKLIVVVIIFIMLTTVTLSLKNKSAITWVNDLIPISKVTTEKKIVAIACNVYEGNEQIIKILDTLDNNNTKISFFIGGIWAKKNPEILTMIKDKGQDIQNHGYLHKRPTTLNQQKNLKEIKDSEEIIYQLTKVRTSLFEPPYGDYDENTLTLVNSINYKLITWSIDTIDWRNDATKDIILNRIKRKLHPGAIILMHPKSVTADSLNDILSYIRSQGYEVTTVKELINQQ